MKEVIWGKLLASCESEEDGIPKHTVDVCTTQWHEQQRPEERHRAYKMWDDARRHSTRGSTVKAMSGELWKGGHAWRRHLGR